MDVQTRAGKNLGFLEFFYRFLGFFRFFKGFFKGFLGFNVHNAEHIYTIYDRQVAYMKISANSLFIQCAKLPNLKVIDG